MYGNEDYSVAAVRYAVLTVFRTEVYVQYSTRRVLKPLQVYS